MGTDRERIGRKRRRASRKADDLRTVIKKEYIKGRGRRESRERENLKEKEEKKEGR